MHDLKKWYTRSSVCKCISLLMQYLCHGDGSLLGEGVIVEVDDAQLGVVLQGVGHGRDAWVVDAILRNMDLLQAAHQLNTQQHTQNTNISGVLKECTRKCLIGVHTHYYF